MDINIGLCVGVSEAASLRYTLPLPSCLYFHCCTSCVCLPFLGSHVTFPGCVCTTRESSCQFMLESRSSSSTTWVRWMRCGSHALPTDDHDDHCSRRRIMSRRPASSRNHKAWHAIFLPPSCLLCVLRPQNYHLMIGFVLQPTTTTTTRNKFSGRKSSAAQESPLLSRNQLASAESASLLPRGS